MPAATASKSPVHRSAFDSEHQFYQAAQSRESIGQSSDLTGARPQVPPAVHPADRRRLATLDLRERRSTGSRATGPKRTRIKKRRYGSGEEDRMPFDNAKAGQLTTSRPLPTNARDAPDLRTDDPPLTPLVFKRLRPTNGLRAQHTRRRRYWMPVYRLLGERRTSEPAVMVMSTITATPHSETAGITDPGRIAFSSTMVIDG